MSNILKYQNPSSPLLNPHKIIENIPAREWGPRKINEDYSITEGKGTNFWRTPFQYLGNKGYGIKNEKLARELISDFDKMRKENPDYDYTLDKNYEAYEDAIHYIDHLEGLKKYLGLPYDTNALVESTYKPTRLQGTNEKTYKFKSSAAPGYWNDTVEDMIMGEYDKMGGYWDQSLHEFTAYRDRDEKGDFISIYDEWDYNPAVRGGNKKLNKVIDSVTGGTPFVIYDRVYLDDYYDIPKEARGNPFITPAVVTAEAKKFGGIIKAQNSAKLISKINQSDANFVKRLLDSNRNFIPDWETNGKKIATHKLGWATDENGAIVYPNVQDINGQLIDFTRPEYGEWDGLDSAIERRDTVRMTPEQAKWFTENYKQYYPSFKKGGSIHIKKKNRGKFTEYCGGKVTEECIAKGKKSKDPKIRKRATFASNSRRWKHENGGPLRKPNFKESKEAYYDPETDTVFAPDSSGEFYHHEMFHARPNLQLLESLKPYYHNLNDDILKQMGADLSFVKRFNNDPGHFYSPEELGARVVSASEMLNRMGVKDVTLDFLKNTRLNENAYGDNFRDLLHMYNDENLIKIFNAVKKHKNGGILKAQEGTGNNFWSKLWNVVKEGGMAARDAKIGAVGTQQVRDLYSEGKNQEAQDLAKQYAKANTTGIALAGGAASTGLLGDLMVTGATTTADTFIDGDVDNFGKNLVKNAAGDLIGHGTSKLLTHLRTNELNKYIDYLNESRRQELFPKSEDVYYHIDTDGRPLFNTNAKLHPSKDASRVLPGLARDEGDIPYIWFNRRATYGTPKHDRIVFGSKEDLHLKPIQETNLPHNEVEGFYVTEGYPNTDKIQMYRGYPISIGGTKPIYVFGKEIFYAPK